VTISIGAAVLQPSADKLVVDLIKLADAGLYRAKDEGRNRVAASP
jgi:diguanylate cyclase (GGDEF)-like protein